MYFCLLFFSNQISLLKAPQGSISHTVKNILYDKETAFHSALLFFNLLQTAISQNIGIGITTPRSKLHVYGGASGNFTPYSPLVVESNNHTYINLLSPDAYETSILFGKPENAASGGIMYNSTANPNGFQFRTNGNATKMVISNNGNVGIGTTSPGFLLNFDNVVGDKISLFGNSGAHYGFGIQGGLLQIHSGTAVDDIAFGYGSSGSFSERFRMKGNGACSEW